MIATLVIGLREGVEAALIVGIIATFLKRNGRTLTAMWIGVAAALITSIGVGVGLYVLESSLPEAAQEGLETVIGAIAVVFVTSMLLWMRGHARTMKRDLEDSAREASRDGATAALAAMAFLAVLKEGFETSVFLLATFRAATDTGQAVAGAVIGLVASVVIGFGIYAGGIRLDLARFFRYTSAFLVLVAAGLVMTAVRTAHEAGWLNAGQQRTIDLAWLAPNGSIQGALITGVLGFSADPRLIEVVAWFAYLIPVALVVYWPDRLRPAAAGAARLRWAVAGGLLVAGAVLALAGPATPVVPSAPAPIVAGSRTIGHVGFDGRSIRTDLTGDAPVSQNGAAAVTTHRGVEAAEWQRVRATAVTGPAVISLEALAEANGGRLPVGVTAQQSPGPFRATWTAKTTTTVWTAADVLLDATNTTTVVLTVTGGGLTTPRTLAETPTALAAAGVDVTVASPTWAVASTSAAATATAIQQVAVTAPESRLWRIEVPIVLLVAAVAVAFTALRGRRRANPRPHRGPGLHGGAVPLPNTARSTPVVTK